jgi:hypothetical protein
VVEVKERAMIKKLSAIGVVLVFVALVAMNCKPTPKGGDEVDEENIKTPYRSTGNEGTITGTIKFDGAAPAPKKIDMGADPNCLSAGGDKNTDDVVVTDGKLANVFVYVTSNKLNEWSFPPPSEPVVLDQHGCRYQPRVLGIQAQQTLRVTNSDPTTHNVHPTPAKNVEWNQSQTPNQAPIERKFRNPETLIPVKCNQHPWMKAHVGVLAHPLFSVSAKDGTFTIKNVPPGDYTIVAWHEKGGEKGTEKTQKITVGAKETKTQDFTFGGPELAYTPPTHLKIAPALVLP